MQTRTDNDSKESSPVEQWTDDALRVKCAELCGWKFAHESTYLDERPVYYAPNSTAKTTVLPDYPKDLNAMHEAEKTLPEPDKYLCNLQTSSRGMMWRATARQRCIALIKTLCPPSA